MNLIFIQMGFFEEISRWDFVQLFWANGDFFGSV
jgi:hypothetical protein